MEFVLLVLLALALAGVGVAVWLEVGEGEAGVGVGDEGEEGAGVFDEGLLLSDLALPFTWALMTATLEAGCELVVVEDTLSSGEGALPPKHKTQAHSANNEIVKRPNITHADQMPTIQVLSMPQHSENFTFQQTKSRFSVLCQ